ncbi:hypothetical protein LX32DRAFT_607182 [Colletotrichum zoysiae]|uniref:Zn(2)-C6 fungal-type domain-containing protein n=1 Tax=Colletotrichum zoysiae TaxID=1216348 RepID=A0AAD9HU45_9PEZI|nr:hypothetical protein LX32DRAFT_607182 [Colletotrichum zoysiae]
MLPSTRKTITRSRNGCAVCKSKRLKCDEAKPYCSRCQRLGISCPGYQMPLKWTNTSSRPPRRDPTSPGSNGSGSIVESPEKSLDGSQSSDQSRKELCDMDFFNHFTDMNTPGSLGFHDTDSIEPLFPFSNVLIEKDHSTASAAAVTASSLQPCGISPGFTSDDAEATTSMVERVAPVAPSPPSQHETSLLPSLQDNSSVLVEYYFKEVCGMMSCYDSKLNPYRTTIANLWGTSPSLYYVTQSMAAACLSEVSPGLVTVSGRLRDQAIRSLWNESRVGPTDTSSLLSLVMLGFSLCWHDPSSLGQSEFELLAETMSHLNNQGGNLTPVEKQKRFFFYNSLVYWKMLLSFVTDKELPVLGTAQEAQPQPAFGSTPKNVMMPHPQTGIGVDVQELVAQVGALVRKERRRIRRRQHSSRHDIEQSINAIRTAEQLQAKLCLLDLPREAAVIDSGDEMTPTDHLLRTAEAYRCTGLLQLYRNFPDLLFDGTSPVTLKTPPSWLDASGSSSHNRCEDSGVILGTWLTSLALHVIDLVQSIPISSRSRSIQPLLLVSVCSELSLGRTFVPAPYMEKSTVASIGFSPRMKVSPTMTDVLLARRLIVSRLTSFEGILAAKPIRQMLKLVKETWACMDSQQEDVYWMDVMMERGYETLLG